jgi:hypothetical protein
MHVSRQAHDQEENTGSGETTTNEVEEAEAPRIARFQGYGQYFSIADEIVALDEYSGPDYSYGDAYIADRANRKGKPGSPASWITACVNHHITFTANAHATNMES